MSGRITVDTGSDGKHCNSPNGSERGWQCPLLQLGQGSARCGYYGAELVIATLQGAVVCHYTCATEQARHAAEEAATVASTDHDCHQCAHYVAEDDDCVLDSGRCDGGEQWQPIAAEEAKPETVCACSTRARNVLTDPECDLETGTCSWQPKTDADSAQADAAARGCDDCAHATDGDCATLCPSCDNGSGWAPILSAPSFEQRVNELEFEFVKMGQRVKRLEDIHRSIVH